MEENIFIESTVKLGKNVKIYPFNVLMGSCVIGDNCVLYPYNFIKDSEIGNDCEISSSNIVNSTIGANSIVGPFARIRPDSKIGDNCKIGNFVEVKNSTLQSGTKASHLAYIGDAEVGENTNIGCGAIFVNYNGKIKNKIRVGKGCFVGSNVNLIAPLNVADNTYICAGTTLTKNTDKYDFVIGRTPQMVKPDLAKKYLKGED